MICPNCGSNMSDKRKRCERCGTDLTIYKRILRVSNLYYNRGLEKAKVRDLTGAVVALRKSLDLNKLNINARNLLGLVYFEMGETVAALSEWVISRHFQSDDNDADEYINKVQSNPTRLDSLNQAIKRYNTALNFAKQGSDDLAIIQLKKVVSLNPHFLRAFHLLALLYMKAGDYEKAKRYLIRAGKIDVSNTQTLRYLKEMEEPVSKDPDTNLEAEQPSGVTNTIMPISTYKEDKPNIMAFVNLVIGVLIGIAVTSFLIIPNVKKNIIANQNTDYTNNASAQTQLSAKDDEINTLNEKVKNYEDQIKELQTKISNAQTTESSSPLLLSASLKYLDELGKAKGDRDFTAVADTLATIDDTKLEDKDSKDLLKRLRDETYPTVAKSYWESGHAKYLQGKYEDALKDLAKAMTLDTKNPDPVYFTGRTYDRMGDKENAKTYYNKIITDFADSKDRVTLAKRMINNLK